MGRDLQSQGNQYAPRKKWQPGETRGFPEIREKSGFEDIAVNGEAHPGNFRDDQNGHIYFAPEIQTMGCATSR